MNKFRIASFVIYEDFVRPPNDINDTIWKKVVEANASYTVQNSWLKVDISAAADNIHMYIISKTRVRAGNGYFKIFFRDLNNYTIVSPGFDVIPEPRNDGGFHKGYAMAYRYVYKYEIVRYDPSVTYLFSKTVALDGLTLYLYLIRKGRRFKSNYKNEIYNALDTLEQIGDSQHFKIRFRSSSVYSLSVDIDWIAVSNRDDEYTYRIDINRPNRDRPNKVFDIYENGRGKEVGCISVNKVM